MIGSAGREVPTSVLLTGGRQTMLAGLRPVHRQYGRAVLARLDLRSGSLEMLAARSRSELDITSRACSPLYRSGAVTASGTVVTCLPDRVVELEPHSGVHVRELSHPWFNDVHHVRPAPDDGVYVVSTGLDLVLEVEWSGQVRRQWPLGSPSTWQRFDDTRDYRLAMIPKPHTVHPNFALAFRNELWITRFYQKDLYCVDGPRTGARVRLADCGVHDGALHDTTVWCTAVDGRVLAVDLEELAVKADHEVPAFGGVGAHVGWYRGILPLEDGTLLVGVSRLRRTRLHENLLWLRNRNWERPRYRHSVLLHVCPSSQRVLREFDLRPAGLDAVYAVLP